MKIRSICAVLLIFAVLFSFCACRKSVTSGEVVTVTDEYGNTYTSAVGSSDTLLTDENGQPITSESTTLSPEAQSFIDSITDVNKQDEYFEKDDAKLEISNDPINIDKMETVDVKTDENGDPIHSEIQQNNQTITNIETADKYTIKMTIESKSADGESSTVQVTTMKRGQDIYVQTKLPTGNGLSLPISMVAVNGKCTIYMDSLRAYMDIPNDTYKSLTEEMEMGVQKDNDAEFVKSGNVTVNGKTYLVDVYKDGDTEIRYFYLNGDIKRVETEDTDGNVTIIEYTEISDKVDDSKFAARAGYMNMSALMDSEEFGGLFG